MRVGRYAERTRRADGKKEEGSRKAVLRPSPRPARLCRPQSGVIPLVPRAVLSQELPLWLKLKTNL
jgi:hypothetical protein